MWSEKAPKNGHQRKTSISSKTSIRRPPYCFKSFYKHFRSFDLVYFEKRAYFFWETQYLINCCPSCAPWRTPSLVPMNITPTDSRANSFMRRPMPSTSCIYERSHHTDWWGTGTPDVKVLRLDGICSHMRHVPPLALVLPPKAHLQNLPPEEPWCAQKQKFYAHRQVQ